MQNHRQRTKPRPEKSQNSPQRLLTSLAPRRAHKLHIHIHIQGTILEVFLKMASIEASFFAPMKIGMAMLHFLGSGLNFGHLFRFHVKWAYLFTILSGLA